MRLRRLHKKALGLEGGADEFLKGLSSNGPDAPRSAFLDARGNIVAVFDQARTGADSFLILIESSVADRLRSHLSRHLDLAGAVLSERPLNAYFDLDGSTPASAGDITIPQKKGQIIVTPKELLSTVSDVEFALFRLRNDIPLQGVDFDREMLLNLGDLGLVSFTKGCFLGQEIIARVHHRGKPPKRLVVRAADACTEAQARAMTSRAKDPETGKTLGFVFVDNG